MIEDPCSKLPTHCGVSERYCGSDSTGSFVSGENFFITYFSRKVLGS